MSEGDEKHGRKRGKGRDGRKTREEEREKGDPGKKLNYLTFHT